MGACARPKVSDEIKLRIGVLKSAGTGLCQKVANIGHVVEPCLTLIKLIKYTDRARYLEDAITILVCNVFLCSLEQPALRICVQ